MKVILTFIIGLILIISSGYEDQMRFTSDSDEYLQHEIIELSDSLKIKFKPDIAIGQISLLSSKNIDNYLGRNVMDRLVDKRDLSSSVISSDSKQRLTFYFHPGSVKKEFSEFQVNYVMHRDENEIITKETEFVTESGIELGITIDRFMLIKGNPDSLTNNGTIVLHYRIDDIQNSKFLETYNMPIYYADYEFRDGFLIKFKFGFEYP